jgi:hypothetical protein
MSQLRRLVRKTQRSDPNHAALARLEQLLAVGVITPDDASQAADLVRAGASLPEAIMGLGGAQLDAAIDRLARSRPDVSERMDVVATQILPFLART